MGWNCNCDKRTYNSEIPTRTWLPPKFVYSIPVRIPRGIDYRSRTWRFCSKAHLAFSAGVRFSFYRRKPIWLARKLHWLKLTGKSYRLLLFFANKVALLRWSVPSTFFSLIHVRIWHSTLKLAIGFSSLHNVCFSKVVNYKRERKKKREIFPFISLICEKKLWIFDVAI